MVVAGALPPLRAHILRRVRVARGGVRPPARAVEGLLRVPHAAAAARRALLQHRPAALARLAQPPQPPAAAHSRSGPDRFSTYSPQIDLPMTESYKSTLPKCLTRSGQTSRTLSRRRFRITWRYDYGSLDHIFSL